MKHYQKKSGFTLIELLVVVLIIGILSAIALPQYRMAVEKARVAERMILAKNIVEAQQRCLMANGQYCEHFADLDIQMSGGEVSPSNENRCETWKLGCSSCHMCFNSKMVTCSNHCGNSWLQSANIAMNYDGKKRYCMVHDSTGKTGFHHQVCKSLGGVKTSSGFNESSEESVYTYYRLP